jgi:hypothetical protein
MNLVDNLANQFKTSELVQIAEAIGLSPTSRWGSRKLIDAILGYIKKSGIPKDLAGTDSRRNMVEEFLYVAGFINGDGNVEEGEKTDRPPLEEFMEANKIENRPDCYGYQDDGDPACKRCTLNEYCVEERLENLPPCYALLFDMVAEECKKCFEAPLCKVNKKEQ